MMDESEWLSPDLWGRTLKFGESFMICTRGPEGPWLPSERKECMAYMCKFKKVGVCGQMECVYDVQISCSWAVCGICTSGCCKAVYRRSQMRARQFEAGNEWCPLSLRQHSNRSISHTCSSYTSHMQVGKSTISNLQGQKQKTKIERLRDIECNYTKSMANST